MRIHWIWMALYWAWILTEVTVLLVTRTRKGGGEVKDRGSLMVLWVVIFTAMSVGSWVGVAYGPAKFQAGHGFAAVCVGLLGLGLAIRLTAILMLGRSFSVNVAIHATQTLYTKGLFRVVRHPSYTGLMLIFVAMGMATHSWLGLGIIVALPMGALLYRMQVEEEALTGAFGAEYVAYSARTKRLIPWIY